MQRHPQRCDPETECGGAAERSVPETSGNDQETRKLRVPPCSAPSRRACASTLTAPARDGRPVSVGPRGVPPRRSTRLPAASTTRQRERRPGEHPRHVVTAVSSILLFASSEPGGVPYLALQTLTWRGNNLTRSRGESLPASACDTRTSMEPPRSSAQSMRASGPAKIKLRTRAGKPGPSPVSTLKPSGRR